VEVDESDSRAPGDDPVRAGGREAQNTARSNLVGAGEGLGAMRAARLSARHAMVQPLEQPRLEPAGIAGTGEALQHRCRRSRANHRGSVRVDVGGQESRGAEVVSSRDLGVFDGDGGGLDLVVRPDEGAASVGPADGT
jgi:hypothetical protein